MNKAEIVIVIILFIIGVSVNTYTNWCSVMSIVDAPKIYRTPAKKLLFTIFNLLVSGIIVLVFILNRQYIAGIIVLLFKWGINKATFRHFFWKEVKLLKEIYRESGKELSDTEAYESVKRRISGEGFF